MKIHWLRNCILPLILLLTLTTRVSAIDFKMGGNPIVKTDKDKYKEATEQCLAENRAMVVWVGYNCIPCERDLIACVHVHMQEFPSATAPCVIIAVPKNGEMIRIADLKVPVDTAYIKNLIWPPPPTMIFYPPFNGVAGCPTGNCGGGG